MKRWLSPSGNTWAQLTRNLTRRGELAEKDPAVVIGLAVGIPVEDEPGPTHDVIDENVAACGTTAGVEGRHPGLSIKLTVETLASPTSWFGADSMPIVTQES